MVSVKKVKSADKQNQIHYKLKSEAQQLRIEFAESLLKLVTSGFGFVAALAWNELIKEVVEVYVKPLFGESSGLVSLLIYALIVTTLAVIVTYNLSKISQKKEE